jgi:hypothetical protein
LGSYGIKGNDFRYNTEPVNLPTVQGSTYWDVDDNTIAVVLNGYVMKVGEDVFYAVKNQTGSTITKGYCVRFCWHCGFFWKRLLDQTILGQWTEMRHADASAFTFPAEAKLMFDSFNLSTTDDNFFLFVLTKKSSTQIVKVFHALEGGI